MRKVHDSKEKQMAAYRQSGPVNLETPVRFADPVPSQADVVVIGGGILGVTSAIYLSEEGYKVALVEKGRLACEQSSRNWGWIRQHGRDRDELPIMMEANCLWGELDAKIKGRAGFRREGILYLASSEAQLAEREKWLDIAREAQLDTRLLSAGEVSTLVDQGGKGGHKWAGATYTPSDARAEPWEAVPALGEYAQSLGVAISESCAARSLEITNGRVEGVVTENGTIGCSQVVLCGGAWSSLFLQNHNVRIPQLSVRSTVSATAPMAEVFSGNAADEMLAFRRREDGGYNISISNFHDLYLGPDAFRNFFKWLPVAKEHWHDTRLKFPVPDGFPDGWRTGRKWSGGDVTPFEKCRVLAPEPAGEKLEQLKAAFAERFPHLGKTGTDPHMGGDD